MDKTLTELDRERLSGSYSRASVLTMSEANPPGKKRQQTHVDVACTVVHTQYVKYTNFKAEPRQVDCQDINYFDHW